jgi:hypothetical protein
MCKTRTCREQEQTRANDAPVTLSANRSKYRWRDLPKQIHFDTNGSWQTVDG